MMSATIAHWSDLASIAENGGTIITVSARLAHALSEQYIRWKQECGAKAWETPDIIPLNSWVRRGALTAVPGTGPASQETMLPLTEGIETAVWEEAIGEVTHEDAPVHVPALAAILRHAFSVEQQWQLTPWIHADSTEDTRLYIAVRDAVVARCRAFGTAPASTQWRSILHVLKEGALALPANVVFAGFERTPTAALRQIQELLEARGTVLWRWNPRGTGSSPHYMRYATGEEEILAAASWARSLLEQGEEDIAVVFPRLQDVRGVVQRLFAEVLSCSAGKEDAEGALPSFELSLGSTLAEEPLVHAALLLIDALTSTVRAEEMSRILLSPFVMGDASQRNARALLDRELRRALLSEEEWSSFTERLGRAYQSESGDALLDALLSHAIPNEKRLPSAWADFMAEMLRTFGWPGERSLTSREYQAQLRFHEQLASLAGFDALYGPVSVQAAAAQLRRLIHSMIFQPQSHRAPVQIMGVFEALGQRFRHLRICDMTEESWPPAARPAACIPLSVQKRAGVADASVDIHARDMEAVTRALFHASENVIVTHAMAADDRELLPSPLLGAVEDCDADVPELRLARRVHRLSDRNTEHVTDEQAPPLSVPAAIAGGSRVFTDQARCPFRAFAAHRLGIRTLEIPEHGVRALDRGILIHDVLGAIWKSLGDQRALLSADLPSVIRDAVASVFRRTGIVKHGRLADAMVHAEMECVTRLAEEMLRVDAARELFTDVGVEQPCEADIAGLRISLRTDRVDRLEDGTYAIIDYKTSKKSHAEWLSRRPLEPQLPLYAITLGEKVSALAFGTVRRSECGYTGIAADPSRFSSLKTPESLAEKEEIPTEWSTLLASWGEILESLARAFRDGDARVDPRDGSDTCAQCDFHALCRVDEFSRQNPIQEGTVDE
ncbi:MAG: PD-(D/E)XK nuclease family protein [Bacteroidia bacterium]|nr:PD-(D/E)XK nuclease family protein [Bacteroidia bacterium]